MHPSIEETIREFRRFCATLEGEEERRWVQLFLRIDDALASISASPAVRDDPMAVDIMGGFARCHSMEAIAAQVDLLADHIAARAGGARPVRTTAIGHPHTRLDDPGAPLILRL